MNRKTSTMGVSYLYARDPSIIYSKRLKLDELKPCKLDKLLMEGTVINEEVPKDDSENKSNQIKVFLRIKTGDENNIYTHDENVLSCKIPKFSQFSKNLKPGTQIIKNYTFSKIFQSEAAQSLVFHEIVKERILNFINGATNTLFAYGASGSGKTYTMLGTKDEPGIIPRTLEYLFNTLPKLSNLPNIKVLCNNTFKNLTIEEGQRERTLLKNLLNNKILANERRSHIKTYKLIQKRLTNESAAILDSYEGIDFGLWISFAEIYNENIYDLLERQVDKDRPKLKLSNNNGETYIRNLKQAYVSSALEAYQLLQFGLQNINYASTSINSHSSRSHCVFTIKLVQASQIEEDIRISQFNFCDLAGCERINKTNNIGKRLQESNNINTSLMVLSRCITTIRNSQKATDKLRVPYRESKLTQLFQKALSGQEEIGIIININPILAMIDETIHVLNFSVIAKDILIDLPVEKKLKNIKRNSFVPSSRSTEFSSNVKSSEQEINDLKEEIKDLKNTIYELNHDNLALEDLIKQAQEKHSAEVYEQVSTVVRQLHHTMELQTKKFEKKEKQYLKEIRRLKMKLFEANISPLDDPQETDSDDESQNEDSAHETDDESTENSDEESSSDGGISSIGLSNPFARNIHLKEQDQLNEHVICLDSTDDEG